MSNGGDKADTAEIHTAEIQAAESAEPVGRRLARLCLFAALIAAPWFRGAFLPAVQVWLALLLLAGVALDAIFSRGRRLETPVPKIWWGLVAGTLLGAVQLLPLPPDSLETLSPQAAGRRRAHASLEQAAPETPAPGRPAAPSAAPVSVAPSLTRLELAHLLAAAAAMFLGARLAQNRVDGRWLLGLIALNGTCIAVVGLWARLGDPPLPDGMLFPSGWGPFHNRNNGAGYLLLCVASALGLLAWRYHDQATARLRAKLPADAKLPAGDAPAKLPAQSTGPSRFGGLLMVALFVALALMITAILASLSRGATVALVVGLLAVALVRLRSTARLRGVAVAVVSILAAGGILYAVGALDAVVVRLATLSDVEGLLRDGRVLNWRFGWAAVPEYLRLGSGLGTYRYAYRPFQDLPAEERFNYPENAFLQTLVEAGLPGFLLLVAVLGGAALVAVRLSRADDARFRALGLVGVFVLASQTVHACADNGFYRPAGFLLLAALCGSFCGAAAGQAAGAPNSSTSAPPSAVRLQFAGRAASVFLLIGLTWAIAESISAAPAGHILDEIFGYGDHPSVSEASVRELLGRMETAVTCRPDDGELRRRTAEIYFVLYRRLVVAEIAESRPGIDQTNIWNLATPSVIYDAAVRAGQNNEADTLAALRTRPAVMRSLEPAKRHLEFALVAAPLDAETWLYLGELHFLGGKPDDAKSYFRVAAELAWSRPAMLNRLGLDAAAAGDETFAFSTLKRCWSLNPMFGPGILTALAPKTDWTRLLDEVVPDSIPLLEELHAAETRRGAPADRLDAIRKRIHRLEAPAGEQPGRN